ncbi:hypothetical protein P280DRAFT_325045 [Massarina eburnea CBS 473.64]|uniref:Uncharacterized protein n=1 Tax=Massarina eburnea CBS 473.64 TaxID=1395130 RepID=A0A6A6S1Z0_9PLEO|nr:hypothetical protein P280DRAFT_325045 [Massarina eburnea CBS 473.64]
MTGACASAACPAQPASIPPAPPSTARPPPDCRPQCDARLANVAVRARDALSWPGTWRHSRQRLLRPPRRGGAQQSTNTGSKSQQGRRDHSRQPHSSAATPASAVPAWSPERRRKELLELGPRRPRRVSFPELITTCPVELSKNPAALRSDRPAFALIGVFFSLAAEISHPTA